VTNPTLPIEDTDTKQKIKTMFLDITDTMIKDTSSTLISKVYLLYDVSRIDNT